MLSWLWICSWQQTYELNEGYFKKNAQKGTWLKKNCLVTFKSWILSISLNGKIISNKKHIYFYGIDLIKRKRFTFKTLNKLTLYFKCSFRLYYFNLFLILKIIFLISLPMKRWKIKKLSVLNKRINLSISSS